MLTLFTDTWRVLHFDFRVTVFESAINWAIFTDVLYSIIFFLPALSVVMIQRWHFGRRVFLNVVLWVADHPKGVIYAFGEMLLGSVSWIKQFWGK